MDAGKTGLPNKHQFFNCSSIHLIIIAKLKVTCSQNSAIIPYKVDTGSDGNKMPYDIFRILFSRATEWQLASTKK